MLLHARTLFLCLVCVVLLAPSVLAQDGEPKNDAQNPRISYETLLQVLISTDAPAEKLPASLAEVEKKLKTDFGQKNYRLASTLLNRTSSKGSLEVKGVGSFAPPTASTENYPNFMELLVIGIKPDNALENALQIDNFRFGMRLPVVTSLLTPDAKTAPVINYENTGVTARPLNIFANQPTVIGTMTGSRPNELIVLVLTVKPETAPNRSVAKKTAKN